MTTSNQSIFSALEEASALLKHAWKGVHFDAPPNPKFDAQVLLSAVLQRPIASLFAHGNDILSDEARETFFGFIERRKAHEPVALILGGKAFFGRDFLVSPHTLIPRPETELLVETALSILQEDAMNGASTGHALIVDVGTGSGAIGVTLALESNAPVIAIDASADALDIAKENAQLLGMSERMSFLQGNLLLPFFPVFAKWPATFPVEHLLIAANLPYLTIDQWEALNPNVKNFEPKSALVGGYNGLELYDELFMQLKAKRSALPKRITLLCEIDPAQKERLPRVIRAHFPAAEVGVLNDLAHFARLVVASF
jgi:release factor glutamine methyltransferase